MPAPTTIRELVERFAANRDAYHSGSYNETQLRREFLDPFFKALGWDIDNAAGYAEAYKDVIHEDSIRIGAYVKAPDYCFRIGGARKFFLEAKKPAVDIKGGTSPAFQLRRYAWSAKLPLSILSDFEEFAVYDCRAKPGKDDPASTARVFYCTCREFEDKWDWIASVFSREAVLKGSFDKYAETNKAKRGTAEVDDDFLATIEGWRADLARNLALRNPQISQRELNFAVQRIIDRIIFLRICEDRGIEDYGRLQVLAAADTVYPRLCELFRHADQRYNSGLFHFKPDPSRNEPPDSLTTGLEVDDKLLRDLLAGLYYPESPYEFSMLSADILGQVYEQFLGKVIRLTAGHQAKIEEKPEVRKAGGVYYTPTYIVDYIVRNTVGKLLEGKTPKQVETLRILDMACGSGSFLIGAYQFLLDWHLGWYLASDPERWARGRKPALVQTRGGWHLTIDERKRVLLNSIYGVDIDAQAVEVTKLSLLLKVLEGETQQTLQPAFAIFHERALPDLGSNIKCGNSLIGSDFYQQPDLPLLDLEETLRLNAFDWDGPKGFPEIMKAGGFDAVIGNPPYLGGREWKQEGGREYGYFVSKFSVAEYQFDIYVLFWEMAIRLAAPHGFASFITPNTWLNNASCTKLRRLMSTELTVVSIADYSRERVFPDAVVLPIITILRNEPPAANKVSVFRPTGQTLDLVGTVPQTIWGHDDLRVFNIDLRADEVDLRSRVESLSQRLEDVATVKFGIKIYETGKGVPPQTATDAQNHVFEAQEKLGADYRPYLEGKDVGRFGVSWRDRWLRYGQHLAAPRDPSLFEGPRILVRRIVGRRLICACVDGDYVTSQLLQIVRPHAGVSVLFLVGVLNSTLVAWTFRKRYNRQDKTFPEIRIYELRSLPVRLPDLGNASDRAIHARMVALVEQMVSMHAQLAAAKVPHEKEAIQRQIEVIDVLIDRLVYELYGLTDEDIRIVEGSTKAGSD